MSAQLVSVTVIQGLTGFAKPTLYRMAREGRIPAIRIGRSIRFDLPAVEKWIAKQPKASA